MAHPKLATAVNRSLLAVSSLALMAGPLAVAGSAQTLEGVTDSAGKIVEDLTCDEARETEEAKLIEEFCPAKKPAKDRKEKADPVEDVVEQVEQTAKDTKDTVEQAISPDSDDDESSDGEGSKPTDSVVPPADGGGGEDGGNGGGNGGADEGGSGGDEDSGRQVSAAGENPRGIEAGPNQHASDNSARPADGAGYSTGGYSGYRSQSALTLQPFAAPLVSVPPVYEFPQIAEQLIIGDQAATAGEPMLAADGTVVTPSTTAVNSYSNGATGMPADPTGWLAATATGLIMLVGAAHALNGGRTPRRAEA